MVILLSSINKKTHIIPTEEGKCFLCLKSDKNYLVFYIINNRCINVCSTFMYYVVHMYYVLFMYYVVHMLTLYNKETTVKCIIIKILTSNFASETNQITRKFYTLILLDWNFLNVSKNHTK